MDKVKTAIIGVGGMAGHHADLLSESDKCEVTAICDLKEDAAKEKAESCGCDYFTDYKEMLEKVDLNAVLVGTPNKIHYQIALDCLDAGIHTAVEYPICQTVAEFDALHEKAAEKGVVLADFATPFLEPQAVEMKKMLPSVGKVMSMRSAYFAGGRNLWYTNEKARGNFYSALTIHQIIYFNVIMGGSPEWVHGALNSTVIDSEKGENACTGTYLCRYSDGTLCYNDWGMGFDKTPTVWDWTIEGDEGRLIYDYTTKPHSITLKQKNKDDVVKELESQTEVHPIFIDSFLDTIREGKDFIISKKDSRSIVDICEKALQSAESGKVVGI
ncbi:MAG: Gfo/Idh/MocA family protein [Planctomycetota bacterium]|jgi:predicted dehydrogenase